MYMIRITTRQVGFEFSVLRGIKLKCDLGKTLYAGNVH
jgi:hypothetical protein